MSITIGQNKQYLCLIPSIVEKLKMNSSIIRKKFIDFFINKGHQPVVAAPIVNKEDPTLLFTNAGMNQFKDLFLDHQLAPYRRATNAQPCLRVSGKHNDLEEVGTDTYHHTMFEMLGNWSFGDYFKEEAIKWAWELLTQVYQLPKERIYVTVFGGDSAEQLAADQEALEIWKKYIAADHILYGTKAENFWEMGDIGPCGPSTEIHIDIRSDAAVQAQDSKQLVNTGHPQVIEIWNLVFIQYNRLVSGQLEELSAKHVDTGLGLERLAMVLQGKESTYDTDIFTPLMQAIGRASGEAYGQSPAIDIAMRVIADHIRAVTFAIADGQIPTNTQAGYVVRRILRRAVRYGYTYLGFEEPFMYRLVEILVQQMGESYPTLPKQQAYIEQVIRSEEEAFLKTLAVGLQRLDQVSQVLQEKGQHQIPGKTAFELYDTYGFPLDLTCLVAQDKGLQVDEAGFQQALQVQRTRSQQAAAVVQSDWQMINKVDKATFVGYDRLEIPVQIVRYRTIQEKGKTIYQLVLDQTPFYAEGGGQIGDTGKLITAEEEVIIVDTQKENELIVHYAQTLPKNLQATFHAVVDTERRQLIANNHTATHLLHAALKQVLGPHVEQRGSLVNDRLLRFDFSHYAKLNPETIRQVEHIVNQKIRANIPLEEQRQVPLESAKAMGATAHFGEKYGEYVRVVSFGPRFSMELCGGTHVPATGQLGLFKIVAESAIAAGTRRIEAATADAAENFINEQLAILNSLKERLKSPNDLVKTVEQLFQEKNYLGDQVARYKSEQVLAVLAKIERDVKTIQGVAVLIKKINLPDADGIKQIAFCLQAKHKSIFLVLVTIIDQKPHIAVLVSEDLIIGRGIHADQLVKELAKPIQGGGGGQPSFATAGGKNVAGLEEVLVIAQKLFNRHITD